ncbi:MAG: ATP-binding protein [Pseudomonadota bacterium]|nr:ATP-binding protein [Pseudomonadota bacterium]
MRQTLLLPADNLKRLFYVRVVALIGLSGALAVGYMGLSMPLPIIPCVVIGVLMAIDNASAWRAASRQTTVSRLRFFWHLAVDVAGLTALFYFTGGYTNPFTSFYLLPLAIAASTLPPRDTLQLALATVVSYSALIYYHIPLPLHTSGHDGFDLHMAGMWGSFVVAAGVIAFFIGYMAEALRQRGNDLAEIRENALRDQQVVAMGALAAGTAHELGTPLSTMALLVDDLRERYIDQPELLDDLNVLREQVTRCRNSINRALVTAGRPRAQDTTALSVRELLNELIAQWRALRPEHEVRVAITGEGTQPRLVVDTTVLQALISVMNNAADACRDPVSVTASWQRDQLLLAIVDRGAGISSEVVETLGDPQTTRKPTGHGVGLFLAASIIRRARGELRIAATGKQGTRVEVTLPLLAPVISGEHHERNDNVATQSITR